MASAVSARYASSPQILQCVEFRTGKSSDILVLKGDADAEFILCGVYQIVHNDFYFTPDGNFDPANSFGTRLQDLKLTCHLTTPLSSVFQFAQDNFPTCTDNLHGLEKLIKHDKNDEVISSMSQHLGRTQFKLTHALFESKPITSDFAEEPDSQNQDAETLASNTDNNTLGPEFAMESWPVAPRCIPHLEELFETHDIYPLPAFDTKGTLIPPSQYDTTLKGATVEVHFTFAHHFIKKNKRHIYTMLLHRLEVLHGPDTLLTSPFKCVRVSAATGSSKSRA
ncbi:hypothetical protein BU15DRAFT_74915 [Melanogaster broomeanus]|nr:hypothetical protein BU15DRAFT_74915 [Melanogaster broomeanus]